MNFSQQTIANSGNWSGSDSDHGVLYKNVIKYIWRTLLSSVKMMQVKLAKDISLPVITIKLTLSITRLLLQNVYLSLGVSGE